MMAEGGAGSSYLAGESTLTGAVWIDGGSTAFYDSTVPKGDSAAADEPARVCNTCAF